MGNGGELSSCEVVFLTGSDGVRLARFKDCIARMSMSLEVVRTDMDQLVGGGKYHYQDLTRVRGAVPMANTDRKTAG